MTMTNVLDCNDHRRRDVATAAGLNGIDHLEVVTADQRTLDVTMLGPLPGEPGGGAGPTLSADQVRIDGGVRVRDVEVISVASNGPVLRVEVAEPGDFSTYTLRLIAGAGAEQPPTGFDPALAAVAFSFKAGCDTTFDCAPPDPPGTPRSTPPVIDYLARDFAGFVRLMSDRMSLVAPAWGDRNPADAHRTMLELIADLGDRLSYEQDSVATEAYLGTARSRISLGRHARLLDHRIDDGANATAQVWIEVEPGGLLDGVTLGVGERFLTGRGGGPAGVSPDGFAAELRAGSIVFESSEPATLAATRNRIPLHTWSDAECTLRTGATAATLVSAPGLTIEPGDRLLLEEVASPVTGLVADADPSRRHIVTVRSATPTVDPVDATDVVQVTWSPHDALPFDLAVSSRIGGEGAPVETAAARGNLVMVGHGHTVTQTDALHVPVDTDRPFRPRLDLADLAVIPADDGTGLDEGIGVGALALDDGSGAWEWRPVPDLLSASADDAVFAVEFEHGHRPALRFGDGRHGRRPVPGGMLSLRARLGTGRSGNVGADALSRMVTIDPAAVRSVRNPLAATGGRDPVGREEIVTTAPAAFRTQRRAVTAEDWIELAEQHGEVERATARIRWTGSWWTVVVAIDRVGGGSVVDDEVLAAELFDYLGRFRMAGTEMVVVDPIFVPLDLGIEISVDAGHYRSEVARLVRAALSPGPATDGSTGLFHPDRLSFGQRLYLSEIHRAIESVAGVRCAEIVVCHPLGRAPGDELASGTVSVGHGEIIRLDDDPSQPELGRLTVDAKGGV